MKTIIPLKIQEEINRRIDNFNRKFFTGKGESLYYFAKFKGKYLYLNRLEFGNIAPVARLKYKGKINNWDFAIFKWSSETYDPDEFFFPGVQHVDGTVEGAMKAGIDAYPV